MEFPVFQFVPFATCPFWAAVKRCWFCCLLLPPFQYLHTLIRSPKPSFLQAIQSQLSQPLLVWHMLHSLNLHDPSLNLLYYVYVSLVLDSPELDTALKLCSHQCLTREEETSSDLPTVLRMLARGQLFATRHPGLFSAKLLSRLQHVLVHRVNPHPLHWHLDLPFPSLELYEGHEQELAHFSFSFSHLYHTDNSWSSCSWCIWKELPWGFVLLSSQRIVRLRGLQFPAFSFLHFWKTGRMFAFLQTPGTSSNCHDLPDITESSLHAWMNPTKSYGLMYALLV